MLVSASTPEIPSLLTSVEQNKRWQSGKVLKDFPAEGKALMHLFNQLGNMDNTYQLQMHIRINNAWVFPSAQRFQSEKILHENTATHILVSIRHQQHSPLRGLTTASFPVNTDLRSCSSTINSEWFCGRWSKWMHTSKEVKIKSRRAKKEIPFLEVRSSVLSFKARLLFFRKAR